MIEFKEYTYEEFPESKASSEDMITIKTDRDERYLIYNKGIKYITRDNLDLRLQMISPIYADQRVKKYPCIVYVQGSAWLKQNIYAFLPQLAKFASRGYVMALVEYRSSTIAPFPAQLQDTKTAIRYLRKNALKYQIDPNNIFVWGDSSGGHCALLAGITQEMSELDTLEYNEVSANVNAVIDYYGPTDITKMNESPSAMDHTTKLSPEGLLIGGLNVAENKKKAQTTNPITYISREKEMPPILIMHGSKDRLVPFEQSVILYEALKANGKQSEFYQLKGADHGGPQFWTDSILDIVDNFLQKYMK